MEIKIKDKILKLGTKYKLIWKGIYGQKHEYIGYLTKLEGKELIFNDDLYLYPKEIISIKKAGFREKETILGGYTEEEIKLKNQNNWWDKILKK